MPGSAGLARADGVPARSYQMHGFAQRRKLHRPVRIVGENRAAGGGHGAIHYPVVAALLGSEPHGAHRLPVGGGDRGRDVGEIEAVRDFEFDRWREGYHLEGALQSDAADLLRMRDLAREVARHGEAGDAAEAVLGLPCARRIAGDCKLGRQLAVKGADVGIDAIGKRANDRLGIRAVCRPLGVPIATEVDRARQLIARHCGGPEDLRELTGAGAPPEIDLEEAVRGGDVALREKEVVRGRRIDVRNAPPVAQDFDWLLQAADVDGLGRQDGSDRKGKNSGFHWGHDIR